MLIKKKKMLKRFSPLFPCYKKKEKEKRKKEERKINKDPFPFTTGKSCFRWANKRLKCQEVGLIIALLIQP